MIRTLFRRLLPPALWQKMSDVKWGLVTVAAAGCHRFALARVRRKVRRGKKLRVAFVDTEVAKWKTQSLFDLMAADEHYEPFMLICRRDGDEIKRPEEMRPGVEAALAYFRKKGNRAIDAFDPDDLDLKRICKYKPDLVFYQQTWYARNLRQVVGRALPCYVPYYVANYGSLVLDGTMDLHRYAAYFFLQSEAWVKALTGWAPWYFYSGKRVAVGHPALDSAFLNPPSPPKAPCVIYAPHFSFITERTSNELGISTFLRNGKEILSYAKAHPEMNWVFKPHPRLKRELVNTGEMSRQEVEAYYAEWATLGTICQDCDYQELFNRATAMVTDCGSFLTEFGATGKPVIHLISSTARVSPMKPSQELYSTYYQVRNFEEMYAAFALVLERGEDPNRERRQSAVRRAALCGNYAAKNIMDFFDGEFGIRRSWRSR